MPKRKKKPRERKGADASHPSTLTPFVAWASQKEKEEVDSDIQTGRMKRKGGSRSPFFLYHPLSSRLQKWKRRGGFGEGTNLKERRGKERNKEIRAPFLFLFLSCWKKKRGGG